MGRKTLTAGIAALAALLLAGPCAAAEETGSAQDARAMLERAVVAVKQDEPRALDSFNHGAGGFKERDLYVFCARADGRVDAHIDPAQLGRNLKDLYDLHGVAFGQEMMAVAEEGVLKGVSYMWPKPGSHTPAQKISFITKVADQVCGVGYYR
jgi:signal transduction histidine kinase